MAVPSGYYVEDGRDLSDIFMSGSSSNTTGYMCSEGLDIGDIFAGGVGIVSTGFRTLRNKDVGRLFRMKSDASTPLVWAHVHNDDETYYALDFTKGTNECYHVGNHGWRGYWEYEVIKYQSAISHGLRKLRAGARIAVSFRKGYGADMNGDGSLYTAVLEYPTAANGWILRYNIEENKRSEHDFYFEVSAEFF